MCEPYPLPPGLEAMVDDLCVRLVELSVWQDGTGPQVAAALEGLAGANLGPVLPMLSRLMDTEGRTT